MVKIVNHPLISHKMTIIRDKNTTTKDFHQTVTEIGSLMTYEITKDLLVKEIEIETPISTYEVWGISPEGFYIGMVPTKYEDGKLTISLGTEARSMYYLIVKN